MLLESNRILSGGNLTYRLEGAEVTSKSALAISGLALAVSPVAAAPATDCPNRDAPFSVKSPLLDLLISPEAKALIDHSVSGSLNSASPFFRSTPPSLSAVITLEQLAKMTGMTPATVASLDRQLRKLPVNASDRVARCARYDNDVPTFRLPARKPKILLFEKITGYKDEPSVNAARTAIQGIADRKGWTIAASDKAGVFNPRTLRQFDAVIWNNISGDVLTLSQRAAFIDWLKRGGAYVGMHGSAGDPQYFWDWYPDSLIGARFDGHPMNPQLQEGRILTNSAHPLARGLPPEWRLTDEWYSFKTNPRAAGADIILTLDENSYKPEGMGRDLRMGDHPLAWTKCVGRGRMFYSAIGHKPEVYNDPHHIALLENAILWAVDRTPCKAKSPSS